MAASVSRIQMLHKGSIIPMAEHPPATSFQLGQAIILEQYRTPSRMEYREREATTHLIYLADGQPVDFDFRMGGGPHRRTRIHGEQIWIIPQHLPHGGVFEGAHGGLVLSIASTELEQHVGPLLRGGRHEILPQVNLDDSPLRHTLLALQSALHSDPQADALFTDLFIQAACARLVKRYATWRPPTVQVRGGLSLGRLRHITEFIEANLENPIRLSMLAETSNLSMFHFAKLFKETTGMSPHQYVTQRRMERAKRLLLDNRQSILEIGLSVGFEHSNNFTRAFRRFAGATPRDFRRDQCLSKDVQIIERIEQNPKNG